MYLQEDPVYSTYYNSVSSQRTNTTDPTTNPNRNSYSTHDSDNSNESDEGFYIDPEWDDMVTFRQLRLPFRSSHASLIDTLDENSSLLGQSGFHAGHQRRISSQSFLLNPHDFWQRWFLNWSSTMIKRNFLLVALPVLVTAVWCSVPLVNRINNQGDSVISFWFFLFYYYGFYNFMALFMISQYFHLYSLNWWPKSLGSKFSMFMLWSISMLIGAIMYYTTNLYKYAITWVLLTFCTLNLPLIFAFFTVRKENRNVYRQSLSYAQKLFMYATENRLPSSYRRFLWFCATLLMNLFALVLGQAYATYYFTHPPDPIIWWHPLFYNYTWICIVFTLDAITDYIVEFKIRSWALTYSYRLYYSMIYFIFYRNLFFRFRSKTQFVVIQIASSLWVMINYPARMSLTFFRITQYFGNSRTYENHCRNVGRSFFIRNLTENVTMLAFLCWTNILYYGYNSEFYNIFKDFDDDKKFDFVLKSSLIIWCIELLSSYFTRMVFKKVYNHSVTREAVNDFVKYPEVIWVLMLVNIHVLQDMLFALIDLESLK